MKWRRWIRPALVVTVLAAPIAALVEKGAIERDLTGRASLALAAGGQDWAKVAASADELAVTGTAPASEAQQAAVRVVSALPGVRSVTDQTTLPPIVSPYVWTVRRSGAQVTLAGSVPSEGVRASVLAAARRALPQAAIVDHMSVARGAPAVFAGAATFALARLPGLSDGTLSLKDAVLSVSGTATDAAAYGAFSTGFASAVPDSVQVGALDVLPARATRFVWSANLDSASVTLAGDVPNEAVHQAINAAIKATIPGLPLVDGVAVASGDPPGFADAATFAVSVLQRLKRGGVTLDGLGLDVAGDARSVDDYTAMMDSLQHGLPAGVTLLSADVTAASIAPYLWQADVADGKVTLTGYAPTPDVKAQLTAFAKTALPGVAIDDRVKVAHGEPRMDWVGAVKFAVGELALLGRGTVNITDTGYAVSGEAKDAKTYAQLADQNAHPLPAGLTLKTSVVQPPRVTPFRFQAERRDGAVAVSGYVSNEDDHQAILAAAHRVPGATDVKDTLVFASGAPANFAAAASAAVRALTRLAGGRAAIVDQSVSVAGTAYQEAAIADIGDGLRDALPAGFTLAAVDVAVGEPGQPLTPAACRDQLQAVLKAGHIDFDANNPVVTTDSLGVLDRVAGTMLRCPDAQVEVGVHSDNDGSTPAAALHDRTQARADALVDYLVGAGVKREQLTGVGYGATKPIADNSTSAGRATNRRVEFTVMVPAGG